MSTIKSSAENLTLNADGANNDVIIQSNGSTKVTVDGQNSRVGIGTASPNSTLEVASTGPVIALQRTNHATSGSGSILWVTNDNTEKARIATNHLVDDQGFEFNLGGAHKMLITSGGDVSLSNGDIIFATAGKGIVLGATSNTDANTLDDYEEGTWVPTIVCSTSGSYVMDTGANLLAYTKVGRVVHIQGGCSTASESSPNGNIRMSLPFTPMTGTKDTDYCMGNATLTHHGGTLPNNANMFMSGGTTWVSLYSVADDGTTQYIDHNDVDTAWGIQFSMTYIAA